MQMVLFLYNICVTTFLAVAVASTYYLFRTRLNRVFVAMGILFSLYFVDNSIIFATEFIPEFAAIYDRFFLSSPIFKAAIQISLVFCYKYIITKILREDLNTADYVLMIIYTMVLLTVQIIPNPAWSAWAFYLPTQIINASSAAYGLYRLKKNPSKYQREFYSQFKTLAVIMITMCAFVILEDTFVIFTYDSYIAATVKIFNRSISENIMVVMYCYILVKYTRNVLMNNNESLLGATIEATVPVVNAMESFCMGHSLTEREKEVFGMIIQGNSIAEIGDTLFISEGTVKTHIHNLYQKTEVGRKNELIRKFYTYEQELGGAVSRR